MIFTFSQIQDILAILKRHQLSFIAEQLGLNYLSQTDKDILSAWGIDLNKFTDDGVLKHAFIFGLLADALGDERAKNLSYSDLKKFIASGNFVPLTEDEELALEFIKSRAYTDLNSIGNRIAVSTSNTIISVNAQQLNNLKAKVKNKAENAIKYRKTARQLASDLGHATKDWERDWLRISYYLLHEAYNTGRAKAIFRDYGDEAEVYFDVYPQACKHCKELYLIDPDDENSQPKVFKLKDIIANGNNIGRKVDDWKPTVGPIHPFCRCTINQKRADYEWDAETHSFSKLKKYIPKNKKLQGVKLNINISKSKQDEISKKSFIEELKQAKRETDVNPTEQKIKAGNYKKGHINFGGYEFVIENPRGSYRCGTDANGKKWKIKMNNTYGYFLKTLGKDKDHIDVFINDDVDLREFNGNIFIIDQVNKDSTFDEHKIMYGYPNKKAAEKAYLSNYEKGWRGLGKITSATKEEFDKWIKGSKRKIKPFSEYKK